jgi:hypothetical protein
VLQSDHRLRLMAASRFLFQVRLLVATCSVAYEFHNELSVKTMKDICSVA